MDIAQLFSYVPTLIKYAGVVKDILDVANSNEDTIARLKAQAGPIFAFLEEYGARLFPQAASALHAIGGAVAAYDSNTVKWIQGGVNAIVSPTPPLVVDGVYGPLTRDGVTALQTKLGLRVDGIAGRITQAALDAYFAKEAAMQFPAKPPTV